MKKLFYITFVILIIAVATLLIFNKHHKNDNINLTEIGYESENLSKKIEDKASIKANNDFSTKFFKEMVDQNKEENILISPTGLYFILSMASNGASDKTAAEFNKLLGINNLNKLNEYNKTLIYNFKAAASDKSILANSIWIKGSDYDRSFVKTCKTYYSSDVKKLKTEKEINKWVKKNTHGKIPYLIDNVSNDDKVILVNTIYFDNKWQIPFDKDATKQDKFHLENKKTVKTDFMNGEEWCEYLELKNCDILVYDYAANSSMYFILPKKGIKIAKFTKTLDFNNLFNSERKDGLCKIKVPKFKMEITNQLKDTLYNMGLKTAFSDKTASLNKFCNDKLFISDILQKTTIDISEEKTVATAATGMVAMSGDAGPVEMPKVKEFILNRPFIFAIGDNSSKSILFAGVMYSPVNNP